MIGSDFRYAWRSLNHQRFGSLLVIGMLALGIGSTVAVFSLVNGLFLRPFPFPQPERLVYVNETAPKWNLEETAVNYHDYAQWRRDQKVFEAIALYDQRAFNLATEDGADRLQGAAVTMDFMNVLGVQPVIGRMFNQEEDSPKGPLVTVIGEALWHERYGGRPDVLGKELKLNSRVFTIIGVLPKAAEFPGRRASVGADAGRSERPRFELQLPRARTHETRRDDRAGQRRSDSCAPIHLRHARQGDASSRRSRAICANSSRGISARSPRRSARRSRCC